MKRRLFWQVFPAFLLLIVLAVPAAVWYTSRSFEELYLRHVQSSLESQARLLEPQIRGWLDPPNARPIQELVSDIAGHSDTRFTVLFPSGVVAADSRENPAAMDNHGDRPEIRSILKGGVGTVTRKSYTLTTRMMYVAHPVLAEGRLIGIIRTSIPVSAVDEELKQILQKNGLVVLAIVVAAALFSLVVSRRISRPMEEIQIAAQRFARGELDVPLPVPKSEELAAMVDSLNRMAVELNDRIHAMAAQRYEQETILSSMVEGVLAVDNRERVITVNPAAQNLLGIRSLESPLPTLAEAVRNIHLLQVVDRVRGTSGPVEEQIVLHVPEERVIHVRGNPLVDSRGAGVGVLVVLNDITRLRRLETVRRDFVANVSHELRTPITAVKGFVETLIHGAVHEPEHAMHFLSIIARQVDRLNQIIDDLLSLSRIERDVEQNLVTLSPGRVADVLQSAVQNCRHQADSRNMTLELDCPAELTARMNSRLMEEAVINLLDNAVRYGRPQTTVGIRAGTEGSRIVIRVEDHGPGIAPEHLSRIFERFYRVDAGRSRKEGGSGLGLSIVRHILNAHGGSVQVSSRVGEGSVFSLILPAWESGSRPVSP